MRFFGGATKHMRQARCMNNRCDTFAGLSESSAVAQIAHKDLKARQVLVWIPDESAKLPIPNASEAHNLRTEEPGRPCN